jgi:hypothetical protein
MGDIAVPQGEFAQVPGHISFLFTGDLHQYRLEQHKNADGEEMTVLSTGATGQQKIDEPTEHFCAVLDGHKIKKIKLNTREFIDWPGIVIQEDLEQFMKKIEDALDVAYQRAASKDYPAEMCRPRLRVTYSHAMPETVRRVTKVVKDRAILHWKVMLPEKQLEAKKLGKIKKGQAVTPITMLPTAVNKDESPEVYELCARLLQATNREEEFQRWWAEQMGDK